MLTYSKKIEKAKKLKALADRGVGGEQQTAHVMFERFLVENDLTLEDVADDSVNRYFLVTDYDSDVLYSYIILSVNPFCKMIRLKSKYKVALDESDYIEVKNKYEYFYNLLKKEEYDIMNVLKERKLPEFIYKKEKEYLLTGFLNKHNTFFTPDLQALMKFKQKADKPLINSGAQEILNKAEGKPTGKPDVPEQDAFGGLDLKKLSYYMARLREANYMKANRSLTEKN